jgi:putative membrane protein
MSRPLLAALAVSLSLASPAFAQSQSDSSVPTIPESQIAPRTVATTYEFVATASSGNAFEIEAATLALQKAQAPEVKALAQKMLDDHTAAQAELLAVGKTANTDIAKPAPDGEQQGLLDKLGAADPAAFDAAYVDSQVFAHQRALALFKGYAEGSEPLNQYAAKTLPTLQMHYAMVLDLAAKLPGEAAVQ